LARQTREPELAACETSFSNLEQVLPFAKLAAESQFLRDPEGRNDTALDALTGLASHLGCPPIFSAGLIEMSREAVSLGENRLQKGMEPFGASHRFLQLLEKKVRIPYREITRYEDRAQALPSLRPGFRARAGGIKNPLEIR
jgi:hypothetical protein